MAINLRDDVYPAATEMSTPYTKLNAVTSVLIDSVRDEIKTAMNELPDDWRDNPDIHAAMKRLHNLVGSVTLFQREAL